MSIEIPNNIHFLGSLYTPLPGQRLILDRFNPFIEQKTLHVMKYSSPLSWSRSTYKTIEPRAECCWVYSEQYDCLVIAYGRNNEGKYFNDCWRFDFNEKQWLLINGSLIGARAGARAALSGTKMWIFGGGRDDTFFSDLHSIDIITGEVELIPNNKDTPTGRVDCGIAADENKITIWAGFNGRSPTDIHIYENQSWRVLGVDRIGRRSASFCREGDALYMFGSSRSQGLIEMDLNTGSISSIHASGEEPPPTTQKSVLVNAENFLITFGGTAKSSKFYIFGKDKKQWYVLDVRPDNNTVSLSDGISSSCDDEFQLPQLLGHAACYRAKTRELVWTMGTTDTMDGIVTINTLNIGQSLTHIHMNEDMLNMLCF